jgi:hypothetical protein
MKYDREKYSKEMDYLDSMLSGGMPDISALLMFKKRFPEWTTEEITELMQIWYDDTEIP